MSLTALDTQALAKDREQRLQLAEYELRLAKEDIAELNRRLQEAGEQLQAAQQQAAAASHGAGSTQAGDASDVGPARRHERMASMAQDVTAEFDWARLGEPSRDEMRVSCRDCLFSMFQQSDMVTATSQHAAAV